MALPIDPFLPEIVATLERAGTLVLQAEPGAGKTTRVPPALLGALPKGVVLVLEPRRLAARLAARRVAWERGERVGETVGYRVRFEDVSGPRTRLLFLTEGVLTRRLLSDPLLAGVSAVVLDEFHERHLHGDLALALLTRLRAGPRKDLRLVVMSATIDAERVATFLAAPVVRVPGRTFPVDVSYDAGDPKEPLERRVDDAVARVLKEQPEGDVLVFLPGAGEIARARAQCTDTVARARADLHVLHGALSADEQDRAVYRGTPGPRSNACPELRRRVILSTNVAESSVTIEGVSGVIDSGLARVAAHSPWTGLPTLQVEPISRASADQRAGRAGRTGPGRCVRLFARRDHETRPAFAAPEVLRLDLAETVLALKAAGIMDLQAMRWLDAPPAQAVAAAESLLARLGGLSKDGALTPLGRRMMRLPVHPRLARLVIEAAGRGAGDAGCALAALLGERDVRAGARAGALRGPQTPFGGGSRDGSSDALDLLEAYERRGPGIDRDAARAVADAEKQLRRELSNDRQMPINRKSTIDRGARDEALLISLLAAYPDRVAKRRAARSDELVLCDGTRARLGRESVVSAADWLVAIDATPGGSGGFPRMEAGGLALVRMASEIDPAWLVDLLSDDVRETIETTWNASAERVDVVSRLVYGVLTIEESRVEKSGGAAVEELLAKQAIAAGPAAFVDREAMATLLGRVAFVRTIDPDVSPVDDRSLAETLRGLCTGRRSFAELRSAGLLAAAIAALPQEQRRAVDRLAPEHVTLGRGRRARVLYDAGRPPRVASRIQDFFGMTDGPRIAGGKAPVVLELLAPSQRPVQVTSDLAGFWVRHYPALRRELGRRYPKHKWPEDPLG